MRLVSTVGEVRNNIKIIARERGKIVARRETHNIWLDLGREYLAKLISFATYSPDTYQENARIRYMGFGIGGNRQVALGVANSPPMSVAYPGTNNQTDTDPAVVRLERPVRLSGGTGGLYAPSDVWLGEVHVNPIHSVPSEVTFIRVFTMLELSYLTLLSVPLSEIGLFTSNAVPAGNPLNRPVAYDTFDTLSKTQNFELEIEWTVRF